MSDKGRGFFDHAPRVRNALVRAGIETYAELSMHTPLQLLKLKDFGTGALREVRECLAAHGAHLANDYEARPATLVDRSVIEEALEQLQHTHQDPEASCCWQCRALYTDKHEPGCRYVRVRDALKKAIGQ